MKIANGKVIDAVRIAMTRRHDGYSGKLANIEIYFGDGRIVCQHSSGCYDMGAETDSRSALWRVMNSPSYSDLEFNRFFKR